jgi:hypothetical protein
VSLVIYSAQFAGKVTQGQHIWVEFFKLGFLPNKTCVCPILELKLIGLESLDVVLVDVETKQVKTRAASNLVTTIFLLS